MKRALFSIVATLLALCASSSFCEEAESLFSSQAIIPPLAAGPNIGMGRPKAFYRVFLENKAFVSEYQHRLDELKPVYARILRRLYLEGMTPQDLAYERKTDRTNIISIARTAMRKFKKIVETEEPSPLKLVRDNEGRLEELKPRYAKVIRGRFFEGKTYQALADEDEKKVSRTGIMNRLQMAVAALKELVNSEEPSDHQFVRQHKQELSLLNPRYGKVLLWRFLEGETQEAVAKKLKLSRETYLVLEFRSLTSLRKWVASLENRSHVSRNIDSAA